MNILNELHKVDEYEFEHLIADLWEERGWNTTVTSGSNDRGIDVIAEKDSPFPQKQLIQAKKYSQGNTIGSPEIQQYNSLKQQNNNVDSVIIITTSNFTSQAQETAADLNVKLVNGSELVNIIKEQPDDPIIPQYLSSNKKEDIFESTHNRNIESVDDTPVNNATDLRDIKNLIGCINKLHTRFENDNPSCLDLLVGSGNNKRTYQINEYDMHNITDLRVEEVTDAKKLIDRHGLNITHEDTAPTGAKFITFSSEKPRSEVSPEEVGIVADDVLSTIYNTSYQDLRGRRIWEI